MFVTNGCEILFDAFTAEALNTKQLLSDMACIVQNDGVQLTNRECEQWAEDATQKLLQAHRRQLVLITNTLHALKAMQE